MNKQNGSGITYRVGFLGHPDSTGPRWIRKVEWNAENVGRLKAIGFNVIQIDVAWIRPDDEILNLEDLVELTPRQQQHYPQPVPLRSQPGAEAYERRREVLRQRVALAKQAGMRTLLLVGAPYNAHARYGDNPPNCIWDNTTGERHVLMLEQLARELPGLDDLQVYTYDVDAWLCSEFGECPRCRGIPLHQRLVPFVDLLVATWRRVSPGGRLWWEPWELSAGQSLHCIEALHPDGLGLVMHCNSAEVMATMPVDRWFKNMTEIARQRGIPVMSQYFLGGASEELEPLTHLSHPLVTLRGLKALAAVPGLVGLKEYYGLGPDREDPNLRMTGLFFRNPSISEEAALAELGSTYGSDAGDMIRFWRLTSEAMELFPWETSWFIREVGRSRPDHSLSAATLRGMDCPTPTWRSTRHATFMRIEPSYPPHPWMLEDIQLRCQLTADRLEQALELGIRIVDRLAGGFSANFALNLFDLGRFQRRALAYGYHLRETNLATLLRKARQEKHPSAERLEEELLSVMKADLHNVAAEKLAKEGDPCPKPAVADDAWPEMKAAIELLSQDAEKFLGIYFMDEPDHRSKGIFSLTSR